MKKTALSIILVFLLNVGAVKPAYSGLIIDPSIIAQSIGGNTQVIYDTAVQGIQQANMIKQTATQGINLNFFKSLISAGLFVNAKIENLKPMVASTKGKNSGLLEQERDLYGEAAKAEKGKKVEIVKEDIAKDKANLAGKKNELHVRKDAMDSAGQRYQQLQGSGTLEELNALDEFHNEKAAYEKLLKDIAELEEAITRQEKILVDLEKLAAEAGTEADEKWSDMNTRAEIIKQEKADTGLITEGETGEDEDWGKIKDLENFTVSPKDYQDFIKAYFYEQEENAFTDLKEGKALRTARQQHQAKGDKLERQRKYLVVNTAAHLLQVSATVRRELPIRENKAKDWFEQAKTSKSEIEAGAAYSNSRIENARAMILYARLVAAKLQYLAAKEINLTSPKKQGKIEDNDFGEFDLEKYILTEEYVKELIENSNKTGVISNMQSADIGK